MSKKKTKSIEELQKYFPKIGLIATIYNNNQALVHASNILRKAEECANNKCPTNKKEKLNLLINYYVDYFKQQIKLPLIISHKTYDDIVKYDKEKIDAFIIKKIQLLNSYYKFFEQNEIEGIHGFDSRSKIRSTIQEEFMYFLFNDFVKFLETSSGIKHSKITSGNVEAYSNLYFSSSDIYNFITSPSIKLNTKQQDYAIYREVNISTQDDISKSLTANIPILAIENKTFLDKTMLEGAIATAEKIKMGSPYSVYIVVTETYAVKFEVDPIYSRIDQIFVLRKCKHSKNRLYRDIDADVVKSMYWYVIKHLLRPWSDIKQRLSNYGTII